MNVYDDCDGSGILPSVNVLTAPILLNQIRSFMTRKPIRVLDIGSGMGFLQAAAEHDPDFECHSVEGNLGLTEYFMGDKKHLHVVNFVTNGFLGNFDLTTSFEVLEHIRRDQLSGFFRQAALHAPLHFCSIHVANEENEYHKTIVPAQTWCTYFERKGIKVQQLQCPIEHWAYSAFFLLDLQKMNDLEIEMPGHMGLF